MMSMRFNDRMDALFAGTRQSRNIVVSPPPIPPLACI